MKAGARAKKPWSKPVIHRLDEVRGIGTGSKPPGSIQSYEGRSPTIPYPQYMPQSVAQAQHS